MICHRSSKHSIGNSKYIDFKEISEDTMFIPPIEWFTEFRLGTEVLLFAEGTEGKHYLDSSYSGNGNYLVPPPGTVFTITQDSLT